MLNFELYNPTNYIFGQGQIDKLSDLVPENAKILLAYGGGSIFNNGIHEQVIKNLQWVNFFYSAEFLYYSLH